MFLLIALLVAWPVHSRPVVSEYHGRAKGWSYDLIKDRFGGDESCRLARRDIVISDGFAYFNLGKQVDTAEALYRIDDGPVKSWRALAPRLVAAGVKIQDDSLTNPSQGRVILPLADVIAAREVDIRPAGQKNPRRFRLIALAPAIDLATQRGCHLASERRVPVVALPSGGA